ncbi:hypothetical protein SAMN04488057_102464 [Cyclobacterium lianum]|uniref:ABC transporter ATPase n=1 Tax=Cyclobacterium lianum TaxID=388280 RepID=A0A1M7KHH4_9BACT|nr:hypothetical protein [Cyclobacterium lianum]SHM64688.1 hypothetical protein SAMN04488057_102464 [Cyclobacterium lianum]
MYIPFEEMPEEARIWVYQADRPFDEQEKTWIISKLVTFCNQWNTHGSLMPSSFDIKYDQFIVLSVDESQLGASGCSIDSSVKVLREIETKLNVNLLDNGKVSYLDNNGVKVAFLPEIRQHIDEGSLQARSKVFNPGVNKISDLEKQWLIPADDSWLKKYFSK